MQHILRVPNTSNYVISDDAVITRTLRFGYRYEATRFEDYEVAFGVADEVMSSKKVQIEIEEVAV
jgi:hypothetical protein